MNGGKYIKQAIIASLCEHPDAEKYRQRAFSAGNLEQVMEEMSKRRQTLTKADFLAADDDGKFIIDSAGAWKNFDKIAKVVQAGGDKFTFDDFMTPLGADPRQTLLESAKAHGGLAKLFSVNVWQGRYDEMERLWYKVPVPFRKDIFKNEGLISADLKRQMFAAEGKTIPEDRLAKVGITHADLRRAAADGALFDELSTRLERAGDYFRKEYVLMTDSSGDTLFDNRPAAWNKYDALVRILAAHGERLEVADYIKQVAFAKNILSRAAEHRALNKVFTPAHWADRLPEMLSLWSNVLEGWKTSPMTTLDFNNAYAEAESLTYTKYFQGMSVTGKADLLKPLNETGKPVYPLGLKAVWDRFISLNEFLNKNDEPLTITDLRLRSGEMENTCLMSAVKFGHFDKVAEIAKQSGEPLTMADYLSKDRDGYTLISILAEKNQLALVFSPQVWAGRIADMRALWSHVSVAQRGQVDFQQAETGAKQATLKQRKGGGIRFQQSQ